MRVIGKRKQISVTETPSTEAFRSAVNFNDELHKLPTGKTIFIPKGVYCYKSHEEANAHWLDCVVKGMTENAGR